MLNVKKLKKIRRFGKLRFANDPKMSVSLHRDKILFAIYEKAGEDKRKQLDSEMDVYFRAIESGRLKPGDSLLKLSLSED